MTTQLTAPALEHDQRLADMASALSRLAERSATSPEPLSAFEEHPRSAELLEVIERGQQLMLELLEAARDAERGDEGAQQSLNELLMRYAELVRDCLAHVIALGEADSEDDISAAIGHFIDARSDQ
jgi:hypothetical protein